MGWWLLMGCAARAPVADAPAGAPPAFAGEAFEMLADDGVTVKERGWRFTVGPEFVAAAVGEAGQVACEERLDAGWKGCSIWLQGCLLLVVKAGEPAALNVYTDRCREDLHQRRGWLVFGGPDGEPASLVPLEGG